MNTFKVLTPCFTMALMLYYENVRIGPVIYVVLCGAFSLNWCLEQLLFLDKSFKMAQKSHVSSFLETSFYWIASYIIVTQVNDPSNLTMCLTLFTNILGTFFHFCGNFQKYFVLHRIFNQNINTFVELMTYTSFAILTEHWLPFVGLVLLTLLTFIPGVRSKDESPREYEEYKESNFLYLQLNLGVMCLI